MSTSSQSTVTSSGTGGAPALAATGRHVDVGLASNPESRCEEVGLCTHCGGVGWSNHHLNAADNRSADRIPCQICSHGARGGDRRSPDEHGAGEGESIRPTSRLNVFSTRVGLGSTVFVSGCASFVFVAYLSDFFVRVQSSWFEIDFSSSTLL